MLKRAAEMVSECDLIMQDLSLLRVELYDCAEIPHIFDMLLHDNVLQTLCKDEMHIAASLLYMHESG